MSDGNDTLVLDDSLVLPSFPFDRSFRNSDKWEEMFENSRYLYSLYKRKMSDENDTQKQSVKNMYME